MTETFVEPYPSEWKKIEKAYRTLWERFANTKMTDAAVDQFHRAAVELFGEAGFTVDVAWDAVCQDGVQTGLFLPEVAVSGRVAKEEETDHSRWQWEVQHGVADGVEGVVRADGTFREDPVKKMIV